MMRERRHKFAVGPWNGSIGTSMTFAKGRRLSYNAVAARLPALLDRSGRRRSSKIIDVDDVSVQRVRSKALGKRARKIWQDIKRRQSQRSVDHKELERRDSDTTVTWVSTDVGEDPFFKSSPSGSVRQADSGSLDSDSRGTPEEIELCKFTSTSQVHLKLLRNMLVLGVVQAIWVGHALGTTLADEEAPVNYKHPLQLFPQDLLLAAVLLSWQCESFLSQQMSQELREELLTYVKTRMAGRDQESLEQFPAESSEDNILFHEEPLRGQPALPKDLIMEIVLFRWPLRFALPKHSLPEELRDELVRHRKTHVSIVFWQRTTPIPAELLKEILTSPRKMEPLASRPALPKELMKEIVFFRWPVQVTPPMLLPKMLQDELARCTKALVSNVPQQDTAMPPVELLQENVKLNNGRSASLNDNFEAPKEEIVLMSELVPSEVVCVPPVIQSKSQGRQKSLMEMLMFPVKAAFKRKPLQPASSYSMVSIMILQNTWIPALLSAVASLE